MLSLALPYITPGAEESDFFDPIPFAVHSVRVCVPNSFALLPRADSNQLEHNHNDTRSFYSSR